MHAPFSSNVVFRLKVHNSHHLLTNFHDLLWLRLERPPFHRIPSRQAKPPPKKSALYSEQGAVLDGADGFLAA